MRSFKIDKDPYCTNSNIYNKNIITINPGVTVLVGCNGSGKTTLMMLMKEKLKEAKISYISFDNLREGGFNAANMHGFMGDMQFVVDCVTSSEGENIVMNLGKFSNKIGRWVHDHKEENEMWIFLDACDSGLSIDNVVDVKYLFDIIIKDNPNSDVYIITSANEYELARDEQCFDVQSGEYITFDSYDEYREMILKSKENKNKRTVC